MTNYNMHIVFLADPLDKQNAGIYQYTKNLIENLLEIDKKNVYTFIHQRENPFFEGKNHRISKRIKQIPGYETFRKFFLLPKLLKELKPDVVIEPSHIGPFRTPKGAKKVTIIHDLTPITFPRFHTTGSVIVHKLLLKKIIKDADLLIVPSETTKNDILKYCPTKAKIAVIHGGINQKDLNQNYQQITTPYILYLGTIEPRKNLEILVDAFIELKAEKKLPHNLVLAGKIGWKIKKLLEKIKKHKDIVLTGQTSEEEKDTLYKYADIFVYPSLYEGFGLPPLEAMNYKIPVVCSTGGSLKEIYKNHTLMFDPNDKETLKKHILSSISTKPENTNLRQKLIENGKEYAKTFTWAKTAEEFLKELNGITK